MREAVLNSVIGNRYYWTRGLANWKGMKGTDGGRESFPVVVFPLSFPTGLLSKAF